MPIKTFRAGDEVWIKSRGIKGTVTMVLPINGTNYYKVEREDGTSSWYLSSSLDKQMTATDLESYYMRKVHQGFSAPNVLLDDLHHYFINKKFHIGDRVMFRVGARKGTVTRIKIDNGDKFYNVEWDDGVLGLYIASDLEKLDETHNTKKENETMPTENMKEKMRQIRWVPMNISVQREHCTPAVDFTASLRGYVVTDCDCLSTLDISRDLENRLKLGHARADAAIKKVIFNDPATIVMWEDGTKTVVKCHNEKYDPEKGLAMAFMKKTMGNKGNYYEVVKKALKDYVPKQDEEAK